MREMFFLFVENPSNDNRKQRKLQQTIIIINANISEQEIDVQFNAQKHMRSNAGNNESANKIRESTSMNMLCLWFS